MAVLVGKKAPQFTSKAVVNGGEIVDNFTLEQFAGRYVVLFFYPKDFTFVCPTELHAFQDMKSEFEKLGTELVAVSTDTEESHWGWLQVPKEHGGIKGITYPIVADTNKTIATNYDVLDGSYYYDDNDELKSDGEMIAYRGLFLIDKDQIVRHQLVNDLPLGRNVSEALRMVKALQFHEENGEVCPANWDEGQDAMAESHDGVAEYLSTH